VSNHGVTVNYVAVFEVKSFSHLITEESQYFRRRYLVPSYDHVPLVLQGLTPQDLFCLRPLDVHCRRYVRRQYGYRQCTSPFTVTWSALSVLQKINNRADLRRRWVMAAYEFFVHNKQSSYCNFIRLRKRATRNPYDFQTYSHPQFRGIECALWPTLYLKTAWCKAIFDAQK